MGEILGVRKHVAIYPATHYVTSPEKVDAAMLTIGKELEERIKWFRDRGKLLEAQRIEQRTRYDMEMLRELGTCKGIENYSRHLNGMPAGSRPYTLMDISDIEDQYIPQQASTRRRKIFPNPLHQDRKSVV